MTMMFQRPPRRRRACAALAAMLFSIALPTVATPAAIVMQVVLDQATLVRLPERVATIVIGNPLIADATVQNGGMLVVTAKGYGTTSLVALDRGGNVLLERSIEVVGPRDNVLVVYRGINRESYSCTPDCERRITLGDSTQFFGETVGQTVARTGSAQSAQR